MVLLLPHDALHCLLPVLSDGVLHPLLQHLGLAFLLESHRNFLVGLPALLFNLHFTRQLVLLHVNLHLLSLPFLFFGFLS